MSRDTTKAAPDSLPHTKEGAAQAAQAQAMLAAAQSANGELQALAAFLGIDFRGLLRCLTKAVGLRKALTCLRSDDPLGCLLEAVDLDKVIDCVLEQIPSGNGEFASEFE